MRIGLWCAWWRPSIGLAAGGEISLFSLRVCGMKENLKAGCRMVKGGRKAESSSFSWRDAGILVFVAVFFFRPGDDIDNDNVLGYYTIPWRKPSLNRPLFKPFYIKWRHPNPAILSKKNSTTITTQRTQKRLEVSRYFGRRNRPSSGHLAKKRKRKVTSLVWASNS